MGYSLAIGEHKTETDDGHTFHLAEEVHLPEAPAFGEPTDWTNQRWPSYSAWANFCKACGPAMEELNKELMPTHPGVCFLRPGHLFQVRRIKEYLESLYPGVEPGFDDGSEGGPLLARVVWLEFWVNWALDNCKRPVLVNT